MNSADFQGIPGLNIPGKAFIIVVVVIFSSMSFILGFLVGKNVREKRPEPVAQVAPIPSAAQPPPQPAIQAAAIPDNDAQTETAKQQEAKQIVEKKPVERPEVKKADRSAKEPTKATVKDTPKEVKEEDRDQGQQEKETMYAVQLGAIKNKSEADNLKTKYEKKGYTIYITVSKNKKHEKIYKIRVGRFKDRKEADILALKLKKTDGLNTFVTVIN